jgi:hypothetical protein
MIQAECLYIIWNRSVEILSSNTMMILGDGVVLIGVVGV